MQFADKDCLELLQGDDEFFAILKACFEIDYKERPTADALFKDAFFDGYTT